MLGFGSPQEKTFLSNTENLSVLLSPTDSLTYRPMRQASGANIAGNGEDLKKKKKLKGVKKDIKERKYKYYLKYYINII